MQSDLSSHSQVQFEADRAEKAEKALALKSTVSLKHDDGGHSPILNRIQIEPESARISQTAFFCGHIRQPCI
jgi:hypothetical protein